MPHDPELTAIVVSYNACDELRACLASLKNSTNVRLNIIVVDNASSEPNAGMVEKKFPEVLLIKNKENRGFAAAVNQGIKRSTGTVVLINPDLRVQAETLSTMSATLRKHGEVGILGPRIQYPDGSPQPSVKKFPDWFDLFLILSKVPNFMPSLTRVYNGLTVDYSREQYVDQVMGACFMIRPEALAQVGAFDEGFWLWFEEVDYCKRALAKGWKTYYTPHATVVHVRGASFSTQPSTLKQEALRNSIEHYCRKYFGPAKTRMLAPAKLMSMISGPIIDTLMLTKPFKAKDL